MSFLGAVGGLFGSAAQFGANYGSALLDAKIQRSLRRSVYQDQMHSMRKAGLNPILAAGATPGMGTSGTMQSSDISSAVDTSLKAVKNKEERALLSAQSTSAQAAAREAEAKADTAEMLRDAQRDDLVASARDKNARAGVTEDSHDSLVGKARADYEVSANKSRLTRREIDLDLPAIIADQRQAEAGLTSAREQGVRYENIGKGIDARWVKDYESMIRAGKTADEIIDRLGPIAGALLGARGMRAVERRNRDTNAREIERNQNARRDTDQKVREQDRRDRHEYRQWGQ